MFAISPYHLQNVITIQERASEFVYLCGCFFFLFTFSVSCETFLFLFFIFNILSATEQITYCISGVCKFGENGLSPKAQLCLHFPYIQPYREREEEGVGGREGNNSSLTAEPFGG